MTTMDVLPAETRAGVALRCDVADVDTREHLEAQATARRMWRRRRQLGMPVEKRHGTPPSVFTRRPDLLDLPTVSAGVQWLVRWSA